MPRGIKRKIGIQRPMANENIIPVEAQEKSNARNPNESAKTRANEYRRPSEDRNYQNRNK